MYSLPQPLQHKYVDLINKETETLLSNNFIYLSQHQKFKNETNKKKTFKETKKFKFLPHLSSSEE